MIISTSASLPLPPLPKQVVYQNILKLAYVDKLLDQVHLAFRDRYKNKVVGKAYGHHFDFTQEFKVMALSAGPVPREVISR